MYRPSLLDLAFLTTLASTAYSQSPPPHSVSPKVARPAPAVPQGTIALAVGNSWWQTFDDPALSAAISVALSANKDLAVAEARIRAANAQARMAKAAELPQVGARVRGGAQRSNIVDPLLFPDSSPWLSDGRMVGASIGMSWEPDLWGKVRSGNIAAAADLEVARANLSGAKLSLAAQTAKAWFAAVHSKRQVGIAQASFENYALVVDVARSRLAAGGPSSLDLELALAELSRAKANVELWRQQRDATTRQLEILLGDYPDGHYELAEDLPSTLEAIPVGLTSELVHRRPDLTAAEHQILAADARTQQSRANLRPQFALTSYGGASRVLSDLLSGRMAIGSLAGGLTMPLLNRGRLKGAVEQREALADEALANYERFLLRAYGEVETATGAEAFLASREAALDESRRRTQTSRQLAKERYTGGLIDVVDLLAVERLALESESEWFNVRRARFINRVDLYLALGGGLEEDSVIAPLPPVERGRITP